MTSIKRDHDAMLADTDHDGDNNPRNADESTEVDDNEDDDAVIPPYDANQEALPASPIFKPEFDELKRSIDEVVQMLRSPIEDSKYTDGVVEGLMQEITNRTKSDSPEEVRIALVGDIKAGKSSVINSVLSIGMIARQNQRDAYAAEVHFFDQDARHALVRALFADYFRASPKDDDLVDESKDGDQTVEDYAVMETTRTAFKALFNDHKEFATDANAKHFLATAQTEDDEELLDTLCEWADEAMDRVLGGDTYITVQASTPQDLLWDLAPYLYSVEEWAGAAMVSPWPFVSRIKFGLDNKLLKAGILLTDLPGLSDSNRIRLTNATNHLRQCSHTIVCAEIGRADDDQFIRSHLVKGWTTRGSGRTILVLTHADSLDAWNEPKGTTKDYQVLESLAADIIELEALMTETANKLRTAKGPRRYQLMDTRETAATKLRRVQAQHEERRIGMRSRMVVKKMQGLYAELTLHSVYCVSNAAYKKHQAGFSLHDANPPNLTVEGTMIPALRRQLFLAPADAKINEQRHMVNMRLPGLLSCFSLFVNKTHMARKVEVQKIVRAPQLTVAETIGKIRFRLDMDINYTILEPFRASEDDWVEEARNHCQQWADTYSSTPHLNFLKNNGFKRGKGKSAASTSWNAELISIKSSEIRSWFKDFGLILDQVLRDITNSTKALMSSIISGVRNDPQVTIMALQPFIDFLLAERSNVAPAVDKVMRGMRRETGNIMCRAMLDSSDSYIDAAMLSIYAEAREIKRKKGTPKQRLQNFEMNVTRRGTGVWMRAHDMLRNDLMSMTAKHMQEVKDVAKAFFEGIERKFDMLCSDKESDNADELQLRAKLKVALVQAPEKLETEVRPAADKCFAGL
ncbi:hypothetical protein LTR27_011395 [Elasticomyces elasticus]|nr:hypothetical protein LTR27_011395 [Elasticomyces elasticus]